MGKKHRNSIEMQAMVNRFEESNLTISDFCKEAKINKYTFQYWRDKFNQKGKFANSKATSSFQQIQPVSAMPSRGVGQLKLHFANGRYLELPADYPIAKLSALLKSFS